MKPIKALGFIVLPTFLALEAYILWDVSPIRYQTRLQLMFLAFCGFEVAKVWAIWVDPSFGRSKISQDMHSSKQEIDV